MKLTKKQLEIIKRLETLLSKNILKDCSAKKRSYINYKVDYKDAEDLRLKAIEINKLVTQYKICKCAEINGFSGIAIIL